MWKEHISLFAYDGMAEATAPRITGSKYLNQEVYNVLALCEFRPLFRWFRQMPILPKYHRGRHEHIYSVKTIQSRRMGSAKKNVRKGKRRGPVIAMVL